MAGDEEYEQPNGNVPGLNIHHQSVLDESDIFNNAGDGKIDKGKHNLINTHTCGILIVLSAFQLYY